MELCYYWAMDTSDWTIGDLLADTVFKMRLAETIHTNNGDEEERAEAERKYMLKLFYLCGICHEQGFDPAEAAKTRTGNVRAEWALDPNLSKVLHITTPDVTELDELPEFMCLRRKPIKSRAS